MVFVIFAPFVLFNRAGKAKKSKTKLKEIISKNSLKITKEETWGNSFIGLDQNLKKIIFLKFSELDVKEQLIDISTIKDCSVIEKRKNLNVKDKKESLLEILNLRILFKNGETTDLNFFDAELNYREDFELKRAINWKSQIVELISIENPIKKVA